MSGEVGVAAVLVGWLVLAVIVCAVAPCGRVGWVLLGSLPKRCGR